MKIGQIYKGKINKFLYFNNYNEFYKKNNLIDILLFGSIVKGKDKPNDIDLLIISLNKI